MTEKQRAYHERQKGTIRLSIRKRQLNICKNCGKTFETGGRTYVPRDRELCKDCIHLARYRTGAKAKELYPLDAAYFAGLLDGEGSIFFYRRRDAVALRVSMSNCDIDLLNWCKEITEVGAIVWKSRHDDKHRPGGIWQINAEAAETLLIQIVPYLKVKKIQAQMGIEFQRKLRNPVDKANRSWQYQWLKKMKELNQRGPKVIVNRND